MVKSTNNTGFLKEVFQINGGLKIHNQFIDGSNISLRFKQNTQVEMGTQYGQLTFLQSIAASVWYLPMLTL